MQLNAVGSLSHCSATHWIKSQHVGPHAETAVASNAHAQCKQVWLAKLPAAASAVCTHASSLGEPPSPSTPPSESGGSGGFRYSHACALSSAPLVSPEYTPGACSTVAPCGSACSSFSRTRL